jgi:PBP1b-binding outer membrane lipoprotein LpoB
MKTALAILAIAAALFVGGCTNSTSSPGVSTAPITSPATSPADSPAASPEVSPSAS